MKLVTAFFAALTALIVTFLPLAAAAQGDAGALAREAGERLEAAAQALETARRGRDRAASLTETVGAFEDGLAAMRAGLRRANLREQQLSLRLQSQEAEIAQLLVMLQRLSPESSPVGFLHPGGASHSARASMLASELVPALTQRADRLRQDLSDVTALRLLQEKATAQLREGMSNVQTARFELNKAIAERQELPRRFTEDPIKTALLMASSETLSSFAEGLDDITSAEIEWEPQNLSARRGALNWPVRGTLLRGAGEPDAANVSRPGILVATLPAALVTAPSNATLRFVGTFLDHGQVSILEPEPGTLFIFSGLGVAYGRAGDIVDEGSAIGLMPVSSNLTTRQSDLENNQLEQDASGSQRNETLYIEIRRQNTAEDPLLWFRSIEG